LELASAAAKAKRRIVEDFKMMKGDQSRDGVLRRNLERRKGEGLSG
jgi:hypothetical protein